MTRAFASREAFAMWELERQVLEASIGPIEQHTLTVLRALKCPTDPVAIYAILAGETRRPWPVKTAARDKERALHAMHTLLAIRDTRANLGPRDENAPKAAFAALRAGFFANAIDAAFGAKTRLAKRTQGRKGGQQRARGAQTNDVAILKHATAWRDSDVEIVDEGGTPYASAAAYASAKTKLPLRTVQQRLKVRQFDSLSAW